MGTYEAPAVTEIGSVREMTLGGANVSNWTDEIRLAWMRIPLPGEFS